MINADTALQALDKNISDNISKAPDGNGDGQLLTESLSINDTDQTGQQRLFPPTGATFSLFSENKLLLDQE